MSITSVQKLSQPECETFSSFSLPLRSMCQDGSSQPRSLSDCDKRPFTVYLHCTCSKKQTFELSHWWFLVLWLNLVILMIQPSLLVRKLNNRDSHILLTGGQAGTATLEKSLETFSQFVQLIYAQG